MSRQTHSEDVATRMKDKAKDVGIRPIGKDDLERICGWLGQGDVADSIILTREISFDDQLKWYEQYLKDETKAVFVIEFKGKHVGNVSLFNIDSSHRRAMLTIFIGEKDLRSKGIGVAAIRLMLRYAFTELSLERVSLEVLGDNTQAMKCYEKVGFQREGLLRSYVRLHEKRRDMILFSILRDEFLAGST